jgi:NAD(P)-dependent dehydrogenase (short-subunit alcohol dehydrogenase family)
MAGGKVVVVSGGSAGVGRAVVQEFAAHGYDVAVLARGRAGLDAAVADVTNSGRRGLGVLTDVSDLAAVEAAAQQVEAELGAIDVWINVAFVGALRFFWDTDPGVYRQITDVTYLGQVNGTRVALSRMRARNAGTIVQVGSALGYRGIPLQAAYCGAKHAIKGFTESVIAELKHDGSRVHLTMVNLPGLNTPQFDWNDNGFSKHPTPVPPIYQPETAARAIRFAAEHRRRTMWVGLPTAYTILGNRLAPSFLDWYLAKTGVSGQLTDERAPTLGSNVFEPRDADRDMGAHGAFDDKAHPHDVWSWASMRRAPLLGSAVAAASAAAAAFGRHRQAHR